MSEIAGYLCFAGAVTAFFLAGAAISPPVARARAFALVLAGAGLLGAGGGLLAPDGALLVAFAPLALPVGLAWAWMLRGREYQFDGESDGS